MRRSDSFAGMKCHIAHALEAIGDEWSFLIVRDSIKGMKRFDEFQKSLPMSPSVLTARLGKLVESGILQRDIYSERPPRYEYSLTAKGAQLGLVLDALEDWGRDNLPSDGHPVRRELEAMGLKA